MLTGGRLRPRQDDLVKTCVTPGFSTASHPSAAVTGFGARAPCVKELVLPKSAESYNLIGAPS